MIQAESDPQKREEYLQRLMELPNQVCLELDSYHSVEMSFPYSLCLHIDILHKLILETGLSYCLPFFFPAFLLMQKWGEIIGQARQSVDFLKDQDVIRTVLNILQVLLSNRLGNFCWIY